MKLMTCLFIGLMICNMGCKKDKANGKNKSINQKGVGESANDLLSSGTYSKLTLQIIAVNGFELSDEVVNSTKQFLSDRLNKPQGIIVKSNSISAPGLAPYSSDDLRQLEDDIRTEYNDENEITLYLFIAEDNFTEENVLGLAYRNTSMAIMGGRIRDLTGGIGQPSEKLVLESVIQHEIAHLLGLVNVGTPMRTNHQDVSHGKHCDVKECLMYYAVESGDFISNLVGNSSPPPLDSQCLADLKANGGK